MLPGQDEATGRVAAERLRAQVEAMMLPHPGKTPPGTVTVSGGIATHVGAADMSAAEVIERADRALYTAKESGRNRVKAWSELEVSDAS